MMGKRKIIAMLTGFAFAMLLLGLVGCARSNEGNCSATLSSEESSSDALPQSAEAVSSNVSSTVTSMPETSKVSDVPFAGKFTLNLPESWKNKVVVDKTEDSATVYYKAFYDTRENGYDGKLFSVRVMDSQTFTDEYLNNGPFIKIAVRGGKTAAWIRVTDVRGDENRADEFEEYQRFMRNISDVVFESFAWQ